MGERRDWADVWRSMVDAVDAQTAAVRGAPRASDPWEGQAERFGARGGRSAQPDAFMQFVAPWLGPGDTVLDVGAGTGRHASYLAPRVARVVAVEPSASMRARLAERVERESLANVAVVPEAWPVAAAEACDVAICAHVLYGVREVAPFLCALDRAARRACFILVGVRQPAWVLSPFWERAHGAPRLPLPGADECREVLRELGIAPSTALVPAAPFTFGSVGEALADLRWRLHLTEAADPLLHAAAADLLRPTADGRLAVPHQPAFHQVLWWARDRGGTPREG